MNNKQFQSDPNLILQKAVVDGKYIDVIGPANTNLANPAFKNKKESEGAIRT